MFNAKKSCSIFQNYFSGFAQNLLDLSFQLLETFRVFKLSHFIRKSLRPILKTTALIHFSPCYQKLFNCSKNVQEIVHNKTEEFLSKNKILYTFQSRFRKKKLPCKHLLGLLTDKITTRFEKGISLE